MPKTKNRRNTWRSLYFQVACVLVLIAMTTPTPANAARQDYPIQPVPFTQVKFDDSFWAPRMEVNRRISIPSAFSQCEQTGRTDNFRIAGGLMEGDHRGQHGFDDTDLYKVVEGASYSLMVRPDRDLDAYLDTLIGYFAAAQEEDGYLYTTMTNEALDTVNWCHPHEVRWDNLVQSHELYNAGHLYEAAVAHFSATGKRSFLDVALKNADLVCATFNEDNLRIPPGHEEIELGLVKLFRVTGDIKYLHAAKFFMDIRGKSLDGREPWGPYCQDHEPVVEQSEAVGHAVRAAYLYAAMTDIAAIMDDKDYRAAVDRIWTDIVSHKLYLTGGIGSRHEGESFGEAYELPNDSAYNETCAAIALVNWAHRMFLLHGDSGYIDILERTLYNALMVGVSLDGQHFFYPNPLSSDGVEPFNKGSAERQPWFGCACCPGNVTRFVASVPGLAYAHHDSGVYINLFVNGTAVIETDDQPVDIQVETEYPWDGQVQIRLRPQAAEKPLALNVRVPGWARGEPVPGDLYRFLDTKDSAIEILVNGKPGEVCLKDGYARIERTWNPGDVLTVRFPMPVRKVVSHESVEANRGRVALQRGPILYCLEQADNPKLKIPDFALSGTASIDPVSRPDTLGGIVALEISGNGAGETATAIPYNVWCNRGANAMAVWLKRE